MTKSKEASMIEITKFIDEIADDLNKGYCFTPFIGSGLSFPSGILLGKNFSEYLSYMVYRCIAPPQPNDGRNPEAVLNSSEYQQDERWDLRRGWLPNPTPTQLQQAEDWIINEYIKICGNYHAGLIYQDGKIEFEEEISENEGKALGNHRLMIGSLHRPLVPDILDTSEGVGEWEKEIKKLYRYIQVDRIKLEFSPPPGKSNTTPDYIYEAAIRSLHDWRSTLEFLSRFTYEEGVFHLAEKPDQNIIDSFSLHITWRKKPALGHHVLAHLMRPLRIRKTLTTNFDTLIEQAYAQIKIPLRVLEVPKSSRLPSADTVRAQNALIKLHGGVHDIRADFSLDAPASAEDKQTFREYLFPGSDRALTFLPSHMLVIGFSGNDMRIIEMIKFVLDTRKDFKLYWVTTAENSLKKVNKIFSEEYYAGQVRVVLANNPDLLLYEMYQRITLSLPPGGFYYQFDHFLPPDSDQGSSQKGLGLKTEEIQKKIISAGDNRESSLHIISAKSGVAVPMGQLFKSLSELSRYSCVWLELEYYATPMSLVTEIVKIMDYKLGLYHKEHILLDVCDDDDEKNHEKIRNYLHRLKEYFRITPSRWVFFLYGRNGAGGCSGWRNKYWGDAEYEKLQFFIDIFLEFGFHFVYMPFSLKRSARDNAKKKFIRNKYSIGREDVKRVFKDKERMKEYDDFYEKFFVSEKNIEDSNGYEYFLPNNSIDKNNISYKKIDASAGKSKFESLIKEVLDKFLAGYDDSIGVGSESNINSDLYRKIKFLYVTTLFRQSRHPSAFMSDASFHPSKLYNVTGVDNDWWRANDIEYWMHFLRDTEETKIFFRKPGGYAWKYRDTRLGLQYLLDRLVGFTIDSSEEESKPYYDFLAQSRARLHYWIADWYIKAFHSSNHATPFIEVIYHRLAAIYFAKYAKPSRSSKTKYEKSGFSKEEDYIIAYRCHIIISSLVGIVKSLRLARKCSRFWIQGFQVEELFSVTSMENALGLDKFDLVEHDQVQFKKWGQDANLEGDVDKFLKELLGESYACKESNKHKAFLIIDYINILLVESQQFMRLLRYESGWHSVENKTFLSGRKGSSPLNNINERFEPGLSDVIDFDGIDSFLEDCENCFSGVVNKDSSLKEENVESLISIMKELFPKSESDEIDTKSIQVKFDEIAIEWTETFLERGKDMDMVMTVQALTDMAYRCTKYAKYLVQISKIDNADVNVCKNLKNDANCLWVIVSFLSRFSIDLMRLLDPMFLDEEISLKIKCLSLYGLALGYLNRFYEANRIFNEAISVSISMSVQENNDNTAMLRLRRAEVHILEAIFFKEMCKKDDPFDGLKDVLVQENGQYKYEIKEVNDSWHPYWLRHPGYFIGSNGGKGNRGKLSDEEREYIVSLKNNDADKKEELVKKAKDRLGRLYVAKLGDASVSLEAAEHLLSDHSRSSLWWGLLQLLRIQVFSEHDLLENKIKPINMALSYRRKIEHDDFLDELLLKIFLVSGNDICAKVRALHEYLNAIKSIVNIQNDDGAEKILQRRVKKILKKLLLASYQPGDENLFSQITGAEGSEIKNKCFEWFYESVKNKLDSFLKEESAV